jgi:hypothetical protein
MRKLRRIARVLLELDPAGQRPLSDKRLRARGRVILGRG